MRVKVAPEVPFEASHEPGMLTVVFGEQPAPELRGPVTPDLYRRLFPTAAEGRAARPRRRRPSTAGARRALVIGPVTLRPYVSASWVDADVLAFDNPVPVRDQYLQVAPGVTASMPVRDGLLAAEYEPRLRFFSDIPLVNETSHFAGLKLESPVGSRAFLRLGYRYTRAILETTVVDPGREYFFDLSRFTFHEVSALARVDLGARLSAEAEARCGHDALRRDAGGRLLRLRQPHVPGRPGLRCGQRPEGYRELCLRADPALPGPRDRRDERAQPARHAGRDDRAAHLGLADRGLPPARRTPSPRARARPSRASSSAARCAASSGTPPRSSSS